MTLDFSSISKTKNLLAFSAGIDSTALFFLLLENDIDFDIAIVDYNTREQAKEELAYAEELAYKYNKKIFTKSVYLNSTSNFEKKARDIRYSFFEEIVSDSSYKVLITAHQLNDKLEWFMMQLSKGAGIVELIGFNTWEDTTKYKIYKPLLELSKNDLKEYLDKNNYKYFIDSSNYEEKYKRNYFRHNFTDKFINEYQEGVKNSFTYIQKDLDSLKINKNALVKIEELEIFKNLKDDNLSIRIIDFSLKKRGFLISKAQRKEILDKKELIVSHKIAVCIQNDYIWIAPFLKETINKKEKEVYRLNKIPSKIRSYMFSKSISIKDLMF